MVINETKDYKQRNRNDIEEKLVLEYILKTVVKYLDRRVLFIHCRMNAVDNIVKWMKTTIMCNNVTVNCTQKRVT